MGLANAHNSALRSIFSALRAHAATWVVTGLLPLPILAATDPADSAVISCVYLGGSCGWLAMEIDRGGGVPGSIREWRVKMLAIFCAIAANVLIFIGFGWSAGVQTFFPFPLMAALSAVPAIGMIPWLVRRVRQPHMAMVF